MQFFIFLVLPQRTAQPLQRERAREKALILDYINGQNKEVDLVITEQELKKINPDFSCIEKLNTDTNSWE